MAKRPPKLTCADKKKLGGKPYEPKTRFSGANAPDPDKEEKLPQTRTPESLPAPSLGLVPFNPERPSLATMITRAYKMRDEALGEDKYYLRVADSPDSHGFWSVTEYSAASLAQKHWAQVDTRKIRDSAINIAQILKQWSQTSRKESKSEGDVVLTLRQDPLPRLVTADTPLPQSVAPSHEPPKQPAPPPRVAPSPPQGAPQQSQNTACASAPKKPPYVTGAFHQAAKYEFIKNKSLPHRIDFPRPTPENARKECALTAVRLKDNFWKVSQHVRGPEGWTEISSITASGDITNEEMHNLLRTWSFVAGYGGNIGRVDETLLPGAQLIEQPPSRNQKQFSPA